MALTNVGKFKRWLNKHGAVVLDPASEWEVIRFKTDNEGVSIIYRNRREHNKFTGEAQDAWNAFVNNRPWKAVNRERERMTTRKAVLAKRDGRRCFGCWRTMAIEKLTVEHLLSFSHGGTDNENNLCLLCQECQDVLGNAAVVVKFKLIIQQRLKYSPKKKTEPSPRNDWEIYRSTQIIHKLWKRWGKQ